MSSPELHNFNGQDYYQTCLLKPCKPDQINPKLPMANAMTCKLNEDLCIVVQCAWWYMHPYYMHPLTGRLTAPSDTKPLRNNSLRILFSEFLRGFVHSKSPGKTDFFQTSRGKQFVIFQRYIFRIFRKYKFCVRKYAGKTHSRTNTPPPPKIYIGKRCELFCRVFFPGNHMDQGCRFFLTKCPPARYLYEDLPSQVCTSQPDNLESFVQATQNTSNLIVLLRDKVAHF